ncbi:MAG TPA: nitroreductase [Chitinophagales bacterium]|nr:nitroreductase [Chitinophagales bacterium]
MNILELIKSRRTIDPDLFTGEIVSTDIIEKMLEAANWAPTHGFTEPWRFVVYTRDTAPNFGEFHAALFKELTPTEQFLQKKYEKIRYRSKNCSHVIICINKRGDKSNIPEVEELAATAAAIQNLLLVATANNVGTFWSTGGMCYHDAFKKYFGFADEDKVLGIIYVGKYEIENPTGNRNSDWKEKTIWK